MMLTSKTHELATIISFVVIVATGCVGGYSGTQGRITFDELRYPASMSLYLYGPDNELLTKERELRVIGKFSAEHYYWSTFYSLIQLSYSKEVGEQINRAIEEAGGDGIVNVKVVSTGGDTILNILPIWPNQIRVVVEGDIVKYVPVPDHAQLKAEEVRIITAADDAILNSLPDQCRVIDQGETLFGTSSLSCTLFYWEIMTPAETDGWFPHLTNSLKMRAQKKGANVVRILDLTYFPNEVMKKHKETPLAPPVSDFMNSVAIDVRYWSCPIHNAQQQ